MLVLQINKGDANYFLEQILVDPITTIWNKTCRNGLSTFHVEQDLPMCWNWIWEYKIKCATTQELERKVLCLKENGTPISNKFLPHIAKAKIQDTLCCVWQSGITMLFKFAPILAHTFSRDQFPWAKFITWQLSLRSFQLRSNSTPYPWSGHTTHWKSYRICDIRLYKLFNL